MEMGFPMEMGLLAARWRDSGVDTRKRATNLNGCDKTKFMDKLSTTRNRAHADSSPAHIHQFERLRQQIYQINGQSVGSSDIKMNCQMSLVLISTYTIVPELVAGNILLICW